MADDRFGVHMVYNGSNRNPQSWFYNGLDDSRLKNADDANEVSDEEFSVDGDIRLGVMTTAGYNQSDIEQDHDKCKAQGYMMDERDWRDVEMTCYVHFNDGGGDSRCSLYARSGTHTSGRKCEGTKYTIGLYSSGRMRSGIEEWHNSGYTYFDDWQVGNVEGQWFGFKAIMYNTQDDESVILECWVDENESNDWQMIYKFTDDGQGEEANVCSSQDHLAMTWGGPYAVYRQDGADINVKKFSVREVDPLNRFGGGGTTDPDNPDDGGTGGGGTGSGDGGGGTGSGTDTPSPPPEPPPVIYVRKILPVYYTIDMQRGDPCGNLMPSEGVALQSIYNASPDVLYVDTKDYRRCGIYVNTTKSVFVGKKIRQLKATLKKSTSATLSGLIYVRIRDYIGNIVEEFVGTVDSANVTENDTVYEWNHPNPQHKIEKTDSIYIEYPTGGNSTDYIRIKICNSDKADGENSILVTHDGSVEARNLDKDLGADISI